MMKTYRTLALVAGALALPALAGCSRSPSEEPAAETMQNDASVTEMAPEDTVPAAANMAEPVPAANTAALDDAPPPPPARSVDQQMMDDASATGMTARAQRDAPPTDAAPAQDAPVGNAE